MTGETIVNDQAQPLPRHHQRFDIIPAGFVRYRGKGCPFNLLPDRSRTAQRVELVVRTAEGLGFSGPRRIGASEWDAAPEEIGAIVAYRLAPPVERQSAV